MNLRESRNLFHSGNLFTRPVIPSKAGIHYKKVKGAKPHFLLTFIGFFLELVAQFYGE